MGGGDNASVAKRPRSIKVGSSAGGCFVVLTHNNLVLDYRGSYGLSGILPLDSLFAALLRTGLIWPMGVDEKEDVEEVRGTESGLQSFALPAAVLLRGASSTYCS